MRVTLRLVLSIVVVVSLIVLAFTLVQVQQERGRLRTDLERRASLVAESLGETIESLVEQGHSQAPPANRREVRRPGTACRSRSI